MKEPRDLSNPAQNQAQHQAQREPNPNQPNQGQSHPNPQHNPNQQSPNQPNPLDGPAVGGNAPNQRNPIPRRSAHDRAEPNQSQPPHEWRTPLESPAEGRVVEMKLNGSIVRGHKKDGLWREVPPLATSIDPPATSSVKSNPLLIVSPEAWREAAK